MMIMMGVVVVVVVVQTVRARDLSRPHAKETSTARPSISLIWEPVFLGRDNGRGHVAVVLRWISRRWPKEVGRSLFSVSVHDLIRPAAYCVYCSAYIHYLSRTWSIQRMLPFVSIVFLYLEHLTDLTVRFLHAIN